MAAGWVGKRSARIACALTAAVTMGAWSLAPSASALSLGSAPSGSGSATAGGDHEPTRYIPASRSSIRPNASHYADPGVLRYGQALSYGAPTNINLPAPIVGMAATHTGRGYWLVAADGAVFAYGDATYLGGTPHWNLHAPVLGIVATPTGRGYWLYSQDGGIFSFGDAKFYGSLGGTRLGTPIIGMAANPATGGYWLVAEGGGIFSFHAPFYGSMAGKGAGTMIGVVSTPSGHGYLMASGSGGVFAYGDAPFKGSLGGQNFTAWINSLAIDSSDGGYWLSGADGKVYRYGNATDYGGAYTSSTSAVFPITQIVATPQSDGYWLLEPDAFPTTFTDPPASSAIVNTASNQIQADPDTGYFCNPYGPCEAWCALFATWVWNHTGVAIPSYAFVGDIYKWAVAHTWVRSPSSKASPGDIILYGTGPQNVNTAVHTGIVAQVWPNGAIDTIEGDAGPASSGWLSVIMNGPFLPSDTDNYNGMPIFGFAVP